MLTCHRLDLQTLESRPVMPENLPDHWAEASLVCNKVLGCVLFGYFS